MTEIEYMGDYFHQCLKKGIEDIESNFKSVHNRLSLTEYNDLKISYQDMLKDGNVIYYYRAKLLTENQHRSVTMRMNKALYQQYIKDKLCSMAPLAIQLKKDDNKPNFLFEQV
jgi:hypothetical protein